MSTLTIRSVPEELHERLRGRAERNRRSLNAEALLLLEHAVESLPEEAELRERFLVTEGEVRGPSPVVAESRRSYSGTEPTRRDEAVRSAAGGRALDPTGVKRLLRDRMDRLRALGVRRIGLFGSVLRGESRSGSDIDLLVEFEPGRKSFDRLLKLASYLEALLGREVDIVTTEGLSPYIGPKILEEAEFV